MNFFNSENIKMFPTSKRDSRIDINAMLPTEHNLINLVNRLTGKHAFVISGLEIEGGNITSGSFNIHGYMFTLDSDYEIPTFTPNPVNDSYLALQLKTFTLEGGFEEILVIDDGKATLDEGNTFNGLGIVNVPSNFEEVTTSDNVTTYTLPLAKYNNGWTELIAEDGFGLKRLNTLSQLASDIAIKVKSGPYANKVQDLETYINNNIVIDCGIVE